MLITPSEAAELTRDYLEGAKRGFIGYSTGLDDIDKHLSGGIKQGELVVVAGRPGGGKSMFLYHVANYNAEQGHPWLFVSAEMTAEQLEIRGLSRRALIDSRRLLDGVFMWDDVESFIDVRKTVPLYLVAPTVKSRKNSSITVERIRKVLDNLDVEGVCIDYLQRLRGKSQGRRERAREVMNDIIWGIGQIAVDYSIPVLLGSQVSRRVDGRVPPVPTLGDMKETGNIEEDAHIVLSVTNFAAYYPVGTDIPGSNPVRTVSDRELMIGVLKQRMGIVNKWEWVRFDARYSLLADLERHYGEEDFGIDF